jgi:hypothetical protein
MAKTLQQQGVPWQSKLQGPQARARGNTPTPRRRTVRDRTPLDGRMGGTRDTTTYYDYPSENPVSRRPGRGSNRSYNPASMGSSAGSGIGGLEAEFLLAIVLLVLLMFANSQASYGERIMSLMKRGSLTCLLFFVLALIASTGPGAAKIAKAFGALVIVAILVTSPMNTVFTDVDNLIKNDWVPTSETAGGTGSADSGTQSGTSGGTSNLAQDFINALKQEANLQGQKSGGNPVTTGAKNAIVSTLNGIIPGSGTIIGKLFGI